MSQPTETEHSDVRFRVWVPTSIILRIDELLSQPETKFQSHEDFFGAAILSFLSYKETELRRERGLSY